MDRRERSHDLITSMRAAMDGRLADVWTSMPGIVTEVSEDGQECSVQPATQIKYRDEKGQWHDLTLSLCVNCPIMWPSGGGFTAIFPVKAGDEGWLVFASRCIDGWYQTGKVSPQADLRMHDPSDGGFIPGCRSLGRRLENVSKDAAQLRSDDGKRYVEVGPQLVKLVADEGQTSLLAGNGKVRIEADTLEVHGRNHTHIDAGGTGFTLEKGKITTWTNSADNNPSHPPEVP